MSKDWTGNSVAFSKTLGASNHAKGKRQKHDYYATEPKAVRLLLEMEKFEGGIWECACGEGHLSKEMIRMGYKVKSSDLIGRGFGEKIDFLKVTEKTKLNIITNPPYKYANEFILKALDLVERGKKVAFFLPIRFLEGKERKEIFLKYPPKTIYISSSRLKAAKNGKFSIDNGSALAFSWWIWEKGYKGQPTIKWFN
jgi:hypothetical protein